MKLSNTKRNQRVNGAASLLAATALTLFACGASYAADTTPVPATTTLPFSWLQFKQGYGTANGYTIPNPLPPPASISVPITYGLAGTGVPTMLSRLQQSIDSLPTPGTVPPATELRGYVLGDIGPNQPPPNLTTPGTGGNNVFLNTTPANTKDWAAPFFQLSATGLQPGYITIADDDTAPGGVFTPGGMIGPIKNAYVTSQSPAGYYRAPATSPSPGSPAGTFTFKTPAAGNFSAGDYEVWVYIPNASTDPTAAPFYPENRINDANYTIELNGVPISPTPDIAGGVDQTSTGGQWVQVTTAIPVKSTVAVSVILNSGTGDDISAGSYFVVADEAQLRPASLTIDNTDLARFSTTAPVAADQWVNSTFDSNFYGSNYEYVKAIPRATATPATTATATWTFAGVPISGTYTINAFLNGQTQVATSTATPPLTSDTHVTDAEYTLTIGTLGSSPYYTSTVGGINQSNGGFASLFTEIQIPAGVPITVTLDNTTNNAIASEVDGTPGNPSTATSTGTIVVADAMQIAPEDGSVVGSPVAINITDFPELVSGYTDAAGVGGNPGGKVLSYKTSQLVTDTTGGQTENSTTQIYQAGPVVGSGVSATFPIGQVAYFGRTEFTNTSSSSTSVGPVGPSGAVYAVDSQTGSVIWRFGGNSLDQYDQDAAYVNGFLPWSSTTSSVQLTGPDNDYQGSGYHRVAPLPSTAVAPNNIPSTATWTFNQITAQGQYNVFAWYPSPTSVNNSVTIDNGTSGYTDSPTASWSSQNSVTTGGSVTGYIDSDYNRAATVTGTTPTATASWTFSAPQTNTYTVGANIPASTIVPNTLIDNSGATPPNTSFMATSGWTAATTATNGGSPSNYYGTNYLRVLASGTATETATWTFSSVAAGTYSLAALFPSQAGGQPDDQPDSLPVGWTNVEASNASPTAPQVYNGGLPANYRGSGYDRVVAVNSPAVPSTATWTINAPATDTYSIQAWYPSQTTGIVVDNSDAGFTDTPSASWTVQSTATNGGTPSDYFGANYVRAPAATGTATATATWNMTAPANGTFAIYAWFPSQSGTEPHITDAVYTATVNGVQTTSAKIDQTTGGAWVQIFNGVSAANGQAINISLSNLTTTSTSNFVVADAVRLGAPEQHIDDAIYSVSVNGGAATPSAKIDQTMNGGQWVTIFNGIAATATNPVVVTLPNLTGDALTTSPYVVANAIRLVGSTELHITDANYSVTIAPVGSPASTTVVPVVGTIDQTVGATTAFPRAITGTFTVPATDIVTVTLNNSTAGPTSLSTYVVADAVELIPSNEPRINDATYTITDTTTATTETVVPVDQSVATSGYQTVTAAPFSANKGDQIVVTLDNTTAVATPAFVVADAVQLTPSATLLESHVNVTYTANAVSGGVAMPVNQSLNGGSWTQISTAPVTFNATNNSVTLSNLTTDTITANQYVVAGAIMLQPVGASVGPVQSTPILVRNMRVLVDPTTQLYQPRDVVIFSDTSGRVFCVDAAGNGDGDDTILDASGNTILYNSAGQPLDPTTGLPSTSAAGFHPRSYGSTALYWVWQPDSSVAGIRLRSTPTPAGEPATGDPQRDMPAPGSFALNSGTVSLTLDANTADTDTLTTGAKTQAYGATLYIGNSNGVLYSFDASGVAGNTAEGAMVTDASGTSVAVNLYRNSLDPSEPTPAVNWWFNSGESIAYAPAYSPVPDPANNNHTYLYVTTFTNTSTSYGHLYAIDTETGPIGNDGQGKIAATSADFNIVPASQDYNLNQLTYWSFPDKNGTVNNYSATLTTAGVHHLVTSTGTALTAGQLPAAMPIGQAAGAPAVTTVYENATDVTNVYICANDPNSTTNGHIYAVNALTGAFDWAYPQLANFSPSATPDYDPNAISTMTEQTAAFGGTNTSTPGAFSQSLEEPDSFVVSSSPVTGLITIPSVQVGTGIAATKAGTQIPVLYVGDTGDNMWAIDLSQGSVAAGGTDDRLFFQADALGQVYSTPALLPGSSGGTGSTGVYGGVLFYTTADGSIREMEATPYVGPSGTEIVQNRDFDFINVGGISSPAIAGFDSSVFNGISISGATGPFASVGNLEWVMAGSDLGFCYGFSPGTSSGGSSSPIPGPPPGQGPSPIANEPNLTQNLLSAIVKSTVANPATNTDYTNTVHSGDPQPFFDWGQTIYLQIYGLYSANPNVYPHAVSVTYTVSQIGPGGRALHPKVASIPLLTEVNDQLASNVPTGLGLPTNSYVATDHIDLGLPNNTSQGEINETPGAKLLVSNIRETVVTNSNGARSVVGGSVSTGGYANNGSGTIQAVAPIDQATFGILNPIAITGAAKSADNNVHYITQELGPYSGVTSSTPWSVLKTAAANGNEIPTSTTAPTSGTFVGGVPPDPTAPNHGGIAIQTAPVVVYVGLGEINHGTTGDSGTSYTGDSPTNPAPLPIGVVTINNMTSPIGESLLRVADRSALGNATSGATAINNLRMDSLTLNWADNSQTGGPGAVINLMNWDTVPTAYNYGSNNNSRDYPGMAKTDASVFLNRRITSGATQYQIDLGNGTLDPSSGSTAGDPTGTRQINPDSTLIKVSVRKYQPANLETLRLNSASTAFLNEPHVDALATDIPEGYVATARVFVDAPLRGQLVPGDAYRSVEVIAGVPVDMSMNIDEQTVDVGNVPAGFGLNQPTGTAASDWSPFAGGSVLASGASQSVFQNFFRALTIHNDGNVNLLNVRMDQIVTDEDATPTIASFLPLTSDEVARPYVNPNMSSWYDSLSYIPSFDNAKHLLIGNTGAPNVQSPTTFAASQAIIRSSIDGDIYLKNPDDSTLLPGTSSPFNNATIHKSRVNDATSSILTVPDNPHDYGLNTYTGTGLPYGGQPMVSVAVPLGTPVGTYSELIRAYEQTLPFVTQTGTANTSNPYNGPSYIYQTAGPEGQAAGSVPGALLILNGHPEQFYADPATVLKVTVTESRLTDGSSLSQTGVGGLAGASNMALPSMDTAPSVTANASLGIPPANELQPVAFREHLAPGTTSGSAAAINALPFGVAFISNRNIQLPSITTSPYDLFTSVLAPPANTGESPLSVPSGSQTWWTTPQNETTASGDYGKGDSGQVRSPFILSDGTDQDMMFWVTTSGATGNAVNQTAGAEYTIRESDITSISSSGMTLSPVPTPTSGTAPSAVTALYTSTQPIFGLRGVILPDSSGTEHLVLFWHTRVGGRAAIYYAVVDLVNSGSSYGLGTQSGSIRVPAAQLHAPQLLQVPASLSSVTNPMPIGRYIMSSLPSPFVAPPSPVPAIDDNYLDITYSGTNSVTGETDIYTSRYVLKAANGAAAVQLSEVPVVQQSSGATTMTVPLLNSPTNPANYIGSDVAWVLDPKLISIYTIDSGGTQHFIVNAASSVHYNFDQASNQLIYTAASAPWGTTNVYINAGLGTVRFSNPPPAATATSNNYTQIYAAVVPLAERITLGSRVNTAPMAMLDDNNKEGFPTATSASNPTPPPATIYTYVPPTPVSTGRQWYIWRKSGTAGGDASALSSTLYMTTRRVAVDLHALQNSTTSLHLYTCSNGLVGLDNSSFKVLVSTVPNMMGAQDVSSYVDVDPARARINFPSYMEGLYAEITYTQQDQTVITVPTQPATGAAGILLGWSNEPYVNATNPSASLFGERTVPIATAVNESDPCAFIDPTSQYDPNMPHRVWLFWTSARNATATGSDVYYEALDPKFYPDLP